jgi:hypothetical protein
MPPKPRKSSVLSRPPSASTPASEQTADALLEKVRPLLLQALVRQVTSFDDIEADGACIGDLFGRVVIAAKLAQGSLPPELDQIARTEAHRRGSAQPSSDSSSSTSGSGGASKSETA